jgi:hypothetical protein
VDALGGCIEALELWHPSGYAERVVGVETASPRLRAGAPGARADLVVVAPDERHGNGRDVEALIAEGTAVLDTGGVLWAFVPRRRRIRAERALRRNGLVLRAHVLTVPTWPATEHFVPVVPAVVSDAAARHFGANGARLRAVSALSRTAAGRWALAHLAEGCALVATRSRDVPLQDWLVRLGPPAAPGTASVVVSDRHDERVATLLRFPAGQATPDVVVKRGLDPGGHARVRAEQSALELMQDDAVAAGFDLPGQLRCDDHGLLATTALRGDSAAHALARGTLSVAQITTIVGDRLLELARRTRTSIPPTRCLLDAALLAPASRVAREDAQLAAYVAALRQLAERIEDGPTVVLSAAHGDLTTENLLLDDGDVGVIDWESAEPGGLAMSDLWYALADALVRAEGISYARAVSVLATSPPESHIGAALQRHADALGLTPDQVMLAFHACWLRHGCNELARGTHGPLLDAVGTVARERLLWPA